MKEYVKYGTYLVICATIAFMCATFKDCGEVGQTPDLVVVPRDSAFLPITKSDYKPASTPFEDPVKPVSKLPIGVKEKDVDRVITARKISTNETLILIITKSGDVHIPKDSTSVNYEFRVTEYHPQIFDFGLDIALGFTLNADARISPSISFSMLQINEKILFPDIAADLQSIGIGIGYQFYHDLTVTPLYMWNYSDTHNTIKIKVSYQL